MRETICKESLKQKRKYYATRNRTIVSGQIRGSETTLADAIVKDVTKTLGYGDESVSVAMVEIGPSHWKKEVYQKEILDKQETIYKKPGYTM